MRASADCNEIADLAVSGVFNSAWYQAANPDVAQAAGLDPLLHYITFGWREGRKPNPYFEGSWYRAQYPDVGAADINPLLHYVRQGEHEGHRPSPHFDPTWYRDGYDLAPGELALASFLKLRGTGRVAPSPELWAVLHLSPWRELAERDGDPFVAYLTARPREGPDQDVIATTGLLDSNYYLINGSDVQEAALDPVKHFCRFGWREGRKPNIYFDTDWYRQTNPMVERLRLNPLVHYVLEGEAAGRRPILYFDPAWYRDSYGIPPGQSALAHYLAHRRSQLYSPHPLFDARWYMARYGAQVGANRDPFAHYLHAGTLEDILPSPQFDAIAYRRQRLGRPSRGFPHLMYPERHNPLVHFLRAGYR